MVRKDYDYVDKATALDIVTTKLGHVRVGDDELDTKDGTNDLLIAIEQDYFIVTSGFSMRTWYGEYKKGYENIYEAKTPTTLKQFKDAFVNGYVTIKKVIWD